MKGRFKMAYNGTALAMLRKTVFRRLNIVQKRNRITSVEPLTSSRNIANALLCAV
jgi:hypothetical protein